MLKMKKIAFYALAALAIVSCTKEVEAPVEMGVKHTRTVTIRAGFDTETRTAYSSAGKFSWVAGDRIGVLVTDGTTKKQVAFVTSGTGKAAEFTGEVEEGWTLAGWASYPFTNTVSGYACNDLAWDDEKGGWRLWGSIKPDAENPLSAIPLIGAPEGDGTDDYVFKTATGIVKFTVTNVPIDAVCAYLETPDELKATNNLNGWYTLSEEGTLLMENAIEPYANRYNWNAPDAPNATVDYYFFLPVGSIPAGSKFELLDSNWAALVSFELKQEVEVARNIVTRIAPIELDPSAIYTLEDILGTYEMTVTAGPYSDNNKPGDLVLEASDDPDKGNVMMTCFGGVTGKQYGTFNGVTITFPKDQIFGANPFSDAADKPYVALDFYAGGVIDAVFEVVERGKIKAIGADAMGLRSCTEEDWATYGGGWPWVLCYGSITAAWKVPADWQSLGNGLFFDSYVWPLMDPKPQGPVVVEIFEDAAHPGQYRMPNPYVIAAQQGGITVTSADEWFPFSIKENGQILYEWLNTGLSLPIVDGVTQPWAMFSGEAIEGYVNEYSYVATWTADGKPAMVNLGPCYREGTDPVAALYEIGRDHQFGVIQFTFPEGGLLYQTTIPADKVTVSADQNEDSENPDGDGAAGLVDGKLNTYWHSPWGFIDEHPSAVYGQYVDIELSEALPGKAAFNYCTRAAKVDGFPALVVVGGSTDGETFTEIASFSLDHMKAAAAYENTWIGLPAFDATGYTHLRFGIAKNIQGEDLRVVATEANQKFTHLAELSLLIQ